MSTRQSILVTGADGLLGRHARAALHSLNGAARFSGQEEPWDIREARHVDFDETARLAELAEGVSVVLHFAGINRASDAEVEHGNQLIAQQLATALDSSAPRAHVLFANSTHAERDIPYGRGKARAAALLRDRAVREGALFSDFVLPHVFGEGGRPHYNSATATLCKQVIDGSDPTIGEGAEVELIHAGAVVDAMLDAVAAHSGETRRLDGRSMSVQSVYDKLSAFREDHHADRFPQVSDRLDVALFNTLRTMGFPEWSSNSLTQHSDARGTLFEAAKGGEGGQTFLSWTLPGVERGNHFHRYKIERFVVVSGQATIRIRHVLENQVHTFEVDGNKPVAIDMPTLHTHSIVNTGNEPLLTLFWAHEIFDPENADTWAAPVMVDGAEEVAHKT